MAKYFDELGQEAQWILCNINHSVPEDERNEVLDKLLGAMDLARPMDIRLIVNGVEFSFEPVAKAIDQACDALIEKRAQELSTALYLQAQLKPRDIVSNIYHLQEQVKSLQWTLDQMLDDIYRPAKEDEDET